jgi:polysaccharide export outer membrane protein
MRHIAHASAAAPDDTPPRRASSLARRVAILLAGIALAGCAGMGAYPHAPAQVAASDRSYLIGPLDVLDVVVWRSPELSMSLTVRPDGFISTPLVDDVPAAGRTPSALRDDLQERLGKYLHEPRVSVIVRAFQGIYSRQIRIVGEAAHPQSVPYRQDMTLLDVMIAVGGVTDFADGNAAVLIRASAGSTQAQYSLRIKDLLKRGDISANVAVAPGDIIIVPQSWF